MPVAGVGGLLGNLFFPDLDNRMAQHITPTASAGPARGSGAAGAGRSAWQSPVAPLQARWPLLPSLLRIPPTRPMSRL